MGEEMTMPRFATAPGSLRHPGLVPGSTGPHTHQPTLARHGGCRNKSGMTALTVSTELDA